MQMQVKSGTYCIRFLTLCAYNNVHNYRKQMVVGNVIYTFAVINPITPICLEERISSLSPEISSSLAAFIPLSPSGALNVVK